MKWRADGPPSLKMLDVLQKPGKQMNVLEFFLVATTFLQTFMMQLWYQPWRFTLSLPVCFRVSLGFLRLYDYHSTIKSSLCSNGQLLWLFLTIFLNHLAIHDNWIVMIVSTLPTSIEFLLHIQLYESQYLWSKKLVIKKQVEGDVENRVRV